MARKGTKRGQGAKKRARPATNPLKVGAAPHLAPSQPTAPGPRAGRPNIPGYGIAGENEGRGLLPWSWAEERLARGHNYWLATTRPGGRPHVMPLWGLWWEGAFYFSTGEKTVKARNLAANPECVVCPERGDEAVILEGAAELVPASEALKPLWAAYHEKYKWKMDGTPFYRVRPRQVFGFIETGDLFTKTATRWQFQGTPTKTTSHSGE